MMRINQFLQIEKYIQLCKYDILFYSLFRLSPSYPVT